MYSINKQHAHVFFRPNIKHCVCCFGRHKNVYKYKFTALRSWKGQNVPALYRLSQAGINTTAFIYVFCNQFTSVSFDTVIADQIESLKAPQAKPSLMQT